MLIITILRQFSPSILQERQKRILKCVLLAISFPLFLLSASVSNAFEPGDTVTVNINSNSFKDAGFPPSFTEKNLERATLKAIQAWTQVSGLNLNLQLGDTDWRFGTHVGEITVRASEHTGSSALAEAFFPGHLSVITFFRSNGFGEARRDIDWEVFPTSLNSTDSFANVLIHELGHALGLPHRTGGQGRTVMHELGSAAGNHGPFRYDIEDVLDIYGKRPADEVKVLRSTDQGESWSDIDSDTLDISSTMPLSVNRDDDRMVLFYTNRNKQPSYAVGRNNGTQFSRTKTIQRTSSMYGTSGHGYDDEYMMAWVTLNATLKVIRVTQGLTKHVWKNPPELESEGVGGTPAIHKLASNTWILSYPKISWGKDDFENGRVVSRISTNDGRTWGDEVELYESGNLRALRGVSIASDGPDHIRISFAQSSDRTTNGAPRAGSIITITASLTDDNVLVGTNVAWDTRNSYSTVTEPSIVRTSKKFVRASQGINSKFYAANMKLDSLWWLNRNRVFSTKQFVAPALAAKRNASYVYMFYLD